MGNIYDDIEESRRNLPKTCTLCHNTSIYKGKIRETDNKIYYLCKEHYNNVKEDYKINFKKMRCSNCNNELNKYAYNMLEYKFCSHECGNEFFKLNKDRS